LNCVAGAAAKVEEEPPAKLLDDLFRKTNALPCIYWLPLTDEQVCVVQYVLLVCKLWLQCSMVEFEMA